MKWQLYVKRLVDFVMFVLFVLLMERHLIPYEAHEWIGISLFALFITHNALNYKWYRVLFQGRYTATRVVQTVLNFLLWIAMLGCAISSILSSVVLFPSFGGACVMKDDMAEVLQKMIDADVIVLASPVYFYSIDAQLKAVIDRTVARWLEVKNKKLYYIMTAADDTKAAMETTLACLRGYADCVEGAKERGVIYGTGVYEKDKIKDKPVMQEAYTMGKEI